MGIEDDLNLAETLLEKVTISINRPEENRIDFVISAADLKTAVKTLLIDSHWGYLSAITGLDQPEFEDEITEGQKVIPGQGNIELLYHFCRGAAITTLRVSVPYSDPTVDTICDILSSATLYERETMELFGVNFRGTPNTDRLVLPESWPAGVYPLRKSFTGLEKIETPVEGASS